MAQIKKKFLASNAVDGTKVQYSNNEAFRAKSSSGTDVELFKLDGSNLFQFLQMPRVGSDPSNGNDVSRKSYVDAQILAEAAARVQADAAEQSAREAADSALSGRLDVIEGSGAGSVAKALQDAKDYTDSEVLAEKNRAEGVEADLQDQIDALDTGNAAALAQEISDRQAADLVLQGNIDTEKARIDAILLASDADKDSFAEIVSLINSVDTENDSAFASYVLSNDAALAQEVSDRQAGDASLQSSLTNEVNRATAAESDLQDAIDQEVSDRQAAVSAEQAARESADSDLDARLDVIEGTGEGSVAKALQDAKDYTDVEQAARESADSNLQDQIDALAVSSGGDIAAETAARQAADSAIEARLDVIEGVGEGSIAKAEQDAKDYADSLNSTEQAAREAADTILQNNINTEKARIDAILLASEADKNSFAEIVSLINSVDTENDSAFAGYVLSNDAALAQEITDRQNAVSAEAAARASADTTLQANIDAEAATRTAELPRHAKMASTISSGETYKDLSHAAIETSLNVFIDRLAIHADDDYTVSLVNGVTRITFTSAFLSSEQGPGAGDLFRCTYAYRNQDQSSGGGSGGSGGGGSSTPSYAEPTVLYSVSNPETGGVAWKGGFAAVFKSSSNAADYLDSVGLSLWQYGTPPSNAVAVPKLYKLPAELAVPETTFSVASIQSGFVKSGTSVPVSNLPLSYSSTYPTWSFDEADGTKVLLEPNTYYMMMVEVVDATTGAPLEVPMGNAYFTPGNNSYGNNLTDKSFTDGSHTTISGGLSGYGPAAIIKVTTAL